MSRPTVCIGVDPGAVNGGVAVVTGDLRAGISILPFGGGYSTPEERARVRSNVPAMTHHGRAVLAVERVHPAKMSARDLVALAEDAGRWLDALEALPFVVRTVRPQASAWRKVLGVGVGLKGRAIDDKVRELLVTRFGLRELAARGVSGHYIDAVGIAVAQLIG